MRHTYYLGTETNQKKTKHPIIKIETTEEHMEYASIVNQNANTRPRKAENSYIRQEELTKKRIQKKGRHYEDKLKDIEDN